MLITILKKSMILSLREKPFSIHSIIWHSSPILFNLSITTSLNSIINLLCIFGYSIYLKRLISHLSNSKIISKPIVDIALYKQIWIICSQELTSKNSQMMMFALYVMMNFWLPVVSKHVDINSISSAYLSG